MAVLTAGELLSVWETGYSQTPAQRALSLLRASTVPGSADPDSYTVGQRDANLLRLRQALWGSKIVAVAGCPKCSELLDLSLDTTELLANELDDGAVEFEREIGDFEVRFRLPMAADLVALSRHDDFEEASHAIFETCVISVQKGDVSHRIGDIPAEIFAEIEKCMAEADPLAEIRLNLACPNCENRWSVLFDIASFLWTELDAWAWRTLKDVHVLARAYGWRERDILALSSTRRNFYLGLVGA